MDLPLKDKRAAVVLYSYYPGDPRPRRAAEALVSAGMEVELICLQEKDTEPLREVIDGVKVQRTRLRKNRSGKLAYFVQYARFLISSFVFLTRRSLRHRYDLVHVHNMPDVLVFAALIPKIWRTAIILDLHDPMPELMMSIFGVKADHWLVQALRRLERVSIGFADLALTPNLAFKKLFASRSCRSEKVQIVMNSPKEEIFNPDRFAPDDQLPTSQEFRIMHHGTIVQRHGIDLLIEAIAKVRPQIPGIRLDLYGYHTPFLDTILDLAQQLGVADVVHYHGAKPQSEIAYAIRQCHLGVVPNRRSAFTEINFPTRLFEYLAMHRPVIAPATKGICDYFNPEQLLMFEPDNVADLADRILWARTHRDSIKTLAERGLQVYRENLWQGEKKRFLEHVTALVKAH